MKKCANCKFFEEYNSDNQLVNLCLYFCEDRTSKSECISVKEYVEVLKEEYNDLKKDLKNLFSIIDSDNFNYHLFSYGNREVLNIIYKYGKDKMDCKQRILEYMKDLYEEIQDWEYYFCYVDTK